MRAGNRAHLIAMQIVFTVGVDPVRMRKLTERFISRMRRLSRKKRKVERERFINAVAALFYVK